MSDADMVRPLDIDLGSARAPVRVPLATYARDLVQADLAMLAADAEHSISNSFSCDSALKVRAVHHNAARLLAQGWRGVDVSVATGLNVGTIWMLSDNPAFRDLVAHYREADAEILADVRGRMVQLGLSASEELQARIIERPEDVSNKDLLGVLQTALDRGGHSPVQKSATMTLALTPEELELIKGAIRKDG